MQERTEGCKMTVDRTEEKIIKMERKVKDGRKQ